MRTLSSEMKEAADRLNQPGRWVKVFKVYVDDSTTLQLTDYHETVEYNGEVYFPYPIAMDDLPQTSKPEMHTFNITVGNVDRLVAFYLESGKLIGRDLYVTWVFIPDEI